MRSYAEILAIAAERKGGVAAVLADVTMPKSPAELARIPDDRWLAEMARCIFQAGISWSVVEAKWPGIEDAMEGFDIGPLSMKDDDWLEARLSDTRVIRSGPKLVAIRDNAVFLRRLRDEGESFGSRVGNWPASDFTGLLDWMIRNGCRLGGTTGQYVLRRMGKEGFMLSRDVVARLIAEGVIDTAPGSRKSMAAVQTAFDQWQAESGQSLNTISRVLAQSIGENATH